MSEANETGKTPCREFQMLMMRRLDGEISSEDDSRLDEHLGSCASCAKAFSEFSRMAKATGEVRMRQVSQEEWDLYWCNVYNRLERGLAWFFVTLGAAAALAYGAFRLVMHFAAEANMAFWAKAGVLVLIFGVVLLFVSVIREKLSLRCTDKYRRIRR